MSCHVKSWIHKFHLVILVTQCVYNRSAPGPVRSALITYVQFKFHVSSIQISCHPSIMFNSNYICSIQISCIFNSNYTYVQFKFHVIHLMGNYSRGWIASADTRPNHLFGRFSTQAPAFTFARAQQFRLSFNICCCLILSTSPLFPAQL